MTIFKFMSGASYHFDSIRENYFYFARPDEFDDPLDCFVKPDVDLRGTTHKDYERFKLDRRYSPDEARIFADSMTNDPVFREQRVEKIEKDNEEDAAPKNAKSKAAL